VNEKIAMPQPARSVEPQPGSADQSPKNSPAVDPPPVDARRLAPMPGGIDTDAIRRSWPDVLAKIATISRVTWSFVSQNTTVLDYNGERLLLGLSTDGLLSALRGRNHGEVVRQALIEVIGVDTRVEGVLATDAASVNTASVNTAPVNTAPVNTAPVNTAPVNTAPVNTAPVNTAPVELSALAAESELPSVSSDPEPDDEWTTSTPQRPAGPAPTRTPERPSTPMQRARAAVAQEASRRNTGAGPAVADDSVVSADDEDIEEAGAIGQPVIERVLGGIVIGELDQ
jgi:DNA polymerase-3 subunit gamma/tau